jgi:hypothetical protein
MNVRLLALLALACLAACGCCRSSRLDPYIDAMNAERRALEDELYDLEYRHEMLTEELATCRRENKQLRGEPAEPPTREQEREGPGADINGLAPPVIDPGLQDPDSPQPGGAGGPTPAPQAEPANEGQGSGKTAAPADTRVTHIVLNPRYTGGRSLSDQPGYENLSVLVEPRNESGQYVPQAGRISIALLDPTQEGEAARVAVWRLEPEEAKRCLRRSPPERGIRWQTPWPDGLPEYGKLDLFVRFETTDGRKLETVHQEILITPPGEFSQRWTPRRGERDGDAARAPNSFARQTAPDGAASPPLPNEGGGQAMQPRPTWRPYR